MLDKAKPTQLFGIPREVLIAYNNGGLDAKIANAGQATWTSSSGSARCCTLR